jgi:hypothetical protein
MFTDMTTIGIESTHRREILLAQAHEHRLATIAKAGRQALRRAADEAVARMAGEDAHHDRHSPPGGGAVEDGGVSAGGKVGANRW